MKTLLFVLLVMALSVQDDVEERVQLSKIKDVEKAKSNIKRVAPPYVNFEPCGEYLIIASQDSPDTVKMAYYEGVEIKKGESEVRRYSIAFKKKIFWPGDFNPLAPTPMAGCTKPEFLAAHLRT